MAILASVITQRASRTLLDEARVAWSAAELLDYLNAAQRAVCLVRPDAYTKVAQVSLVAGTAQSLPADANVLLRVMYNGNGVSVRHVGVDAMSAASNWASASASPIVKEWHADSRDRTRFFVSPPNDGTGSLVCFYAAYPPVLASEASAIALPDVYDTPLWAYVCSMAYAKNSRRQDLAKSNAMMQTFMALVTGAQVASQSVFPDLRKIEQGQV